MKKIIFVSALISGLMFTQFANAQSMSRTHFNQEQRIRQGVRRGDLTRAEAIRLQRQQAKIQAMKRMAMADGRITFRERQMIAMAERNANRNIYIDRHNRFER